MFVRLKDIAEEPCMLLRRHTVIGICADVKTLVSSIIALLLKNKLLIKKKVAMPRKHLLLLRTLLGVKDEIKEC
jgi:hypothetical protein